MKRSSILWVLTLGLSVVVPLGCKKKPPATAASSAPPVTARTAETRVPPPPATASQKDRTQEVLSDDLATLNRKGYLGDVYFDFDEDSLREDARTTLARDAAWLKKFPSVQILLEGHCDDRGTDAYNLSLGQRRAGATREYLDELGVAESRVKTVSYGKEKPFCTEETDACRQENRRAHVLVVAK
jgi:peptidoglycan-associated lipoprotein